MTTNSEWTKSGDGTKGETGNSREQLMERIRKNTPNEKLLLQADFFTEALVLAMPFQPDIWTGGTRTKTRRSNHLRLVWQNPKDNKFIELFLADDAKGFFDVDGNRTSIIWIATEEGARDAFRSAFEFIFGENDVK